MTTLAKWTWFKKVLPKGEMRRRRNLAKVFKVKCLNKDMDFSKYKHSDTVLIAGDGHTLPQDVEAFERFAIPHDIYCVNRAMMFFERPIQHWCAVDAEEAVWFSENLKRSLVSNNGHILRHTIGVLPVGYDVFWTADNDLEGYAKYLWAGTTTYMAILTAIEMGYKRIILAGGPLDDGGHWYESEETPGPQWAGVVYTQWMDFKMKVPEANNVRSMSGYSAFILGNPSKEWVNGNRT